MRSKLRHRTVEDVMTSRVHIAGPRTPVELIVRLIKENHVGAIPIVDQRGVPIGVVSETDLLGHEKRTTGGGSVAADVMTSPAMTIDRKATIAAAERLLQERNVRRLVVVDPTGRIAGIVSRSDLLPTSARRAVPVPPASLQRSPKAI
jgi:CBS-domain-containing membrane protein